MWKVPESCKRRSFRFLLTGSLLLRSLRLSGALGSNLNFRLSGTLGINLNFRLSGTLRSSLNFRLSRSGRRSRF